MSRPVMVQVRNVPEDLHRQLKARAAMEGLSISDYVLREIRKSLERPSRHDVLERLRARARPTLRQSAADLVRAERDSR